jgi:uncharacterized protein YndB with AHSA1/START domain
MFELLPDGVRVLRRFRTSRTDAFGAWVDRERLRKWFGPAGMTVVELDGELEVGGEYRFVLHDQAGEATQLRWAFREIAPPERLFFGWQIGPEGDPPRTAGVVEVSFSEERGHTTIELTHTGMVETDYRDHTAAGWAECFVQLSSILDHLV